MNSSEDGEEREQQRDAMKNGRTKQLIYTCMYVCTHNYGSCCCIIIKHFLVQELIIPKLYFKNVSPHKTVAT